MRSGVSSGDDSNPTKPKKLCTKARYRGSLRYGTPTYLTLRKTKVPDVFRFRKGTILQAADDTDTTDTQTQTDSLTQVRSGLTSRFKSSSVPLLAKFQQNTESSIYLPSTLSVLRTPSRQPASPRSISTLPFSGWPSSLSSFCGIVTPLPTYYLTLRLGTLAKRPWAHGAGSFVHGLTMRIPSVTSSRRCPLSEMLAAAFSRLLRVES